MGLYTFEQEENIYLRGQAKVWQNSGFLTKEQLARFEDLTDPKVKTPNPFFRLLFFIFTAVCLGAVIGFIFWLLDIKDDKVAAFFLMTFSIPAYFTAEYLIRKYSFYRHGIEEALLLGSMILFVANILVFLDDFNLSMSIYVLTICCAISIYSFWLYCRFGFLYSLLIAAAALIAIPYSSDLSPVAERTTALLLMSLLLFMNFYQEKTDDFEFRRWNNGIFQACLFFGIYLTCNLRLSDQNLYYTYFDSNLIISQDLSMGFPKYFYWLTYILILIIPVTGLWYGLRKRLPAVAGKRLFIDLGLVTAGLSIMTNKDYLGFKHYSWDPAILGIISITTAIAAIKILSKEKFNAHFGYTSENILKPGRYGIDLMSMGGALLHSSSLPLSAGENKPFTGGESGGAGASRKF